MNLCRVAMSGRVAAKNCSMRVLPASVRGMTAFEEGRFDSAITVPYATVKRHMVGAFKSLFGHYVLKGSSRDVQDAFLQIKIMNMFGSTKRAGDQ